MVNREIGSSNRSPEEVRTWGRNALRLAVGVPVYLGGLLLAIDSIGQRNIPEAVVGVAVTGLGFRLVTEEPYQELPTQPDIPESPRSSMIDQTP